MIRLVQTRTGTPNGNCMATSLAAVLETQVPEFGVNVTDDEFYANMAEWLAEQGYRYRERPVTGTKPKGYHLILGISPRGGRHAIVGKNGEPVWDPHPEDGTGRFLASRDAFGILVPLEDKRVAYDIDSLSLDWEESKHKRDKSGKFSTTSSGSEKRSSKKEGPGPLSDDEYVRGHKEFEKELSKLFAPSDDPRSPKEKRLDFVKNQRNVERLYPPEARASREQLHRVARRLFPDDESGKDSVAHDSEVPQEYRELMLPIEFRTGTCPACGNEATLNMDGTVAEHGTCGGWGLPPTLGNYDNPGRVQDEHVGFKKLEEKFKREGKKDPGGLAYAIGAKKYGKEGMAKKAAAGRAADDFDGLSLDVFEESKHPRSKGGKFSSGSGRGETVEHGGRNYHVESEGARKFALIGGRRVPMEELHRRQEAARRPLRYGHK